MRPESKHRDGRVRAGRWLLSWLMLWAGLTAAWSLEKRDRWSGLNRVESSSTMGQGNAFISMYGRTFLWDNEAAGKIPTALPHIEFGVGILDYLHATGGMQVRTTRPSQVFLGLKATTPNTKNIRIVGVSQSITFYRNLLEEFKSNGFRYKNEGFSPDEFLLGNDDFLTHYRLITAVDFELIKISSRLPLKLYFNAGFEGGFSSWMRENYAEAREIFEENGQGSPGYEGSTNYTKIPLLMGLELKTHASDFFLELESEPFTDFIMNFFSKKKRLDGDVTWVRYNFVTSANEPLLKVVDINLFETPIYLSAGARLKYGNGSTLQLGFSWLLSRDVGPELGPCTPFNRCRDAALDGFSPFYPQWRLFGRISYPIRFSQTSSELYRSYLLRKNKKERKVLDIDSRLKSMGKETDTPEDGEPASGGMDSRPSEDQREQEDDVKVD